MIESYQDVEREIWNLAQNNPELQQVLLKDKLSRDLYSIPTGDIKLDVFTLYQTEESQQKAIDLIKAVGRLDVNKISELLTHLQIYLQLKEAQGEELTPQEKTLKDIDILKLAVCAVAYCMKALKEEREDNINED